MTGRTLTQQERAAVQSAIARGEKRFLGVPCGMGHEGWRYCSTGDCCECVKSRTRKYGDRRVAANAVALAGRARGPGAPAPRKLLARLLLIGPSRTCVFILPPDPEYQLLAALGHLDQLYCGKRSEPGFSYCAEHKALCYVSPHPTRRPAFGAVIRRRNQTARAVVSGWVED